MIDKVAATIPTYNRKDLLLRCLKACLNQSRPIDRIVIVDNASTDGTAELLREQGYLEDPRIDYVRLSSNTGAAGAHHEGLHRAHRIGFGWYWFLDDDAVPEPDALEQLLSAYGRLPRDITADTLALCNAIYDFEGKVVPETRRFFDRFWLSDRAAGVECYEREYFEIDVFGYLGTLVKGRVLDEIGFPLAEYFMSSDNEYSLRIGSNGHIICIPRARVVHKTYRTGKLAQAVSQTPPVGSLPHPIRRYYRLRAKVATYKMYSKSRTIFFLRIAMTYLKIQLKVILFKADKIALLRLYTAALADGWRGRFGKTVGETDLD